MDFKNQKETYLAVLIASLEKKIELLDQLIALSKEQELLIINDSINEERFNQILDEKDIKINRILELDEGFDKIYQNLKEELAVNMNNYKDEIQKLKDRITTVTNKGVQLQVIEKQSKSKMEFYFHAERKKIKEFRLSNQTASSYYKNMTDHYEQQSYFYDKKK